MTALPDQVLFLWLSPAFPVGSFAYSHGLEWAIASGAIENDQDLHDWIQTLLTHGAGRNDLVLLAAGWRAMQKGNESLVEDINQLSIALSASRERHLETVSQGNAFIKAIQDAWPSPNLPQLVDRIQDLSYPVSVAIATYAHGLTLKPVLAHFVMSYVSNLLSAATRLSLIGQTQGQKLLNVLMPLMQNLVEEALESSLEDLGGFSLCADIASMQHETQYSRMFRS
jgi:urease accessory protein